MSTDPSQSIQWFVERDEDSYRHEAKNILESYAHPWDILVELAQNAVDAIDQKSQKDEHFQAGNLRIEVDQNNRSITCFDNGVGIGETEIKKVLRPHFSAKKGKTLRGEKGVGLTYIALVGNQFRLTTKSGGKANRLSLDGAQEWVGGRGSRPVIHVDTATKDIYPKLESYTEVSVAAIPETAVAEEELDIFTLNIKQLAHLLRTRTALGYTGTLFNIPPHCKIEITVKVQGKDGNLETQAIPYEYAAPSTYMNSKSLITLDEVKTHLANDEKRKVLGKAIHFAKVFQTKAQKDVRAYCFLTSRHLYNQLSEDLQLPEDLRIQGGIYIATKGMPTGILLPALKTGRAGYWPNIYLLLEYDNITLDLGRKSITAPRTIEMLGKQAAQVFNDIERYVKYTIREDEGTLDAVVSQDELQEEVTAVRNEPHFVYKDTRTGQTLPSNYPFERAPKQEQDVIALFSMALARGLFPYELLRVSSSYRYDCFLQLTVDTSTKKRVPLVAEFKYQGESILKDLEESKARYGQLQILICWTLDETKLRTAGFIVDRILQGAKKELPGSTHKLSFPSSAAVKDQPVAVICLSQVLHQDV